MCRSFNTGAKDGAFRSKSVVVCAVVDAVFLLFPCGIRAVLLVIICRSCLLTIGAVNIIRAAKEGLANVAF